MHQFYPGINSLGIVAIPFDYFTIHLIQ